MYKDYLLNNPRYFYAPWNTKRYFAKMKAGFVKVVKSFLYQEKMQAGKDITKWNTYKYETGDTQQKCN